MGKDGGRPIRRLLHPLEKPVTHRWWDSTSTSPWVSRQCPLLLHGNRDGGRPRKRGHLIEGAGTLAPAGNGSRGQIGRRLRRTGGPSLLQMGTPISGAALRCHIKRQFLPGRLHFSFPWSPQGEATIYLSPLPPDRPGFLPQRGSGNRP